MSDEELAPAIVTDQQRKMCEMLVGGKSKLAASKELQISRETVYAWLDQPEVAKYLRGLISEAVDALDVQLVGAIDTVQQVLASRLEWDKELVEGRDAENAPSTESLIRTARQLYELAAMRRGLPTGGSDEDRPAGLADLRERTGSLDDRVKGARDVTPDKKQKKQEQD